VGRIRISESKQKENNVKKDLETINTQNWQKNTPSFYQTNLYKIKKVSYGPQHVKSKRIGKSTNRYEHILRFKINTETEILLATKMSL